MADRSHSSADVDQRADELAALRRENQRLRETAGAAVVEQAKGALMLRYGVDADRAHDVLASWSQDCSIDMHTIADTLVNVVCSGVTPPEALEPTLMRWIEEHLRHSPDADDEPGSAPQHAHR